MSFDRAAREVVDLLGQTLAHGAVDLVELALSALANLIKMGRGEFGCGMHKRAALQSGCEPGLLQQRRDEHVIGH